MLSIITPPNSVTAVRFLELFLDPAPSEFWESWLEYDTRRCRRTRSSFFLGSFPDCASLFKLGALPLVQYPWFGFHYPLLWMLVRRFRRMFPQHLQCCLSPMVHSSSRWFILVLSGVSRNPQWLVLWIRICLILIIPISRLRSRSIFNCFSCIYPRSLPSCAQLRSALHFTALIVGGFRVTLSEIFGAFGLSAFPATPLS